MQALYGPADTSERGEPGFVAIGSSGRSDVSERAEEILRAEFGA